MQKLDRWKKFELTGKVSDYLNYKAGRDSQSEISGEFICPEECVKQQGAESRARVFNSDGNDIETDAGGRV